MKIRVEGRPGTVKIGSGRRMTAAEMAAAVKRAARGWSYDRVSLGYPGPVVHGRPIREPENLGDGWLGFDFGKAFRRPVRVLNDAAMQALGAYRGGRMLFLGLGTGLGSALIVDGRLQPLELARLPYRKSTYEEYLNRAALEKRGERRWRRDVMRAARSFRRAVRADEVVLGGGNAKRLKPGEPGVRLGSNADAFTGGLRMWDEEER